MNRIDLNELRHGLEVILGSRATAQPFGLKLNA